MKSFGAMESSELLLPLKNPGTRYNRADIGKVGTHNISPGPSSSILII